ncbi:MAG: sulfur carrier protein ThiS [Sphaerochaetaceae bacterium]|nr:sulfur carrier protein ThiS [Sphaerochaetaceae bacterium]
MTMKIKVFTYSIFINGQKYKIYTKTYCTLQNTINYLDYTKELNIIEINGQIYPELRKDLYLKDKDRLELITVVGGG